MPEQGKQAAFKADLGHSMLMRYSDANGECTVYLGSKRCGACSRSLWVDGLPECSDYLVSVSFYNIDVLPLYYSMRLDEA